MGGGGGGEGKAFFYSIASVEPCCFVTLCTAANGSAQSDANKKTDILPKQQSRSMMLVGRFLQNGSLSNKIIRAYYILTSQFYSYIRSNGLVGYLTMLFQLERIQHFGW